MAIFQLTESTVFPDPRDAEENGLLAVGGDLSTKRLLAAYSKGIFPWYSEGEPPLWWFTDPRLVLFPQEFKVSKRLARSLRNSGFRTSLNEDFAQVINSCAATRIENGEGTWISEEMKAAYKQLHLQGYAHSMECWLGDTLAGGLYGLLLGKVFCGESMFTRISNGSKAALVALVEHLKQQDIAVIDCQMTTSHLVSFGAREISGTEFRELLRLHIPNSVPLVPKAKGNYSGHVIFDHSAPVIERNSYEKG
jgi:leucyl/phenylalanyl-tRNA--protein transferase